MYVKLIMMTPLSYIVFLIHIHIDFTDVSEYRADTFLEMCYNPSFLLF